jgi:predicted RNase H-like HicB family nuclease
MGRARWVSWFYEAWDIAYILGAPMSGDTIKVKIHKAEEGGYWAEVENMPGCVTEGEILEEVRNNLKEAILGWLLAQIPSKA